MLVIRRCFIIVWARWGQEENNEKIKMKLCGLCACINHRINIRSIKIVHAYINYYAFLHGLDLLCPQPAIWKASRNTSSTHFFPRVYYFLDQRINKVYLAYRQCFHSGYYYAVYCYRGLQ